MKISTRATGDSSNILCSYPRDNMGKCILGRQASWIIFYQFDPVTKECFITVLPGILMGFWGIVPASVSS